MDEEDSVSSFGTPEMMARRDSTRKSIASKPKEKEIPRYLRASTGSCHDICKYGKREVTLEKPWRSANRKIFKKGNDDALVETSKPGLLRTKKATTKKVAPDDDSSSSEMVIKREVVKYQVSGGVSSGIKKPVPSGDETPVKKQIKKKVTSSSSKLRPSPDLGSRSVDAVKPKVFKKSYSALATSKPKVNSEKAASSVLKPKMGSKSEDAKMKKTTVPSRVGLKKVPVTPRASLSPRLSMRLAGSSSLKKSQSLKGASSSSSNQKLRRVKRTDESNKQVDGYPVEEKTLHVVEMETKSKGVSEDDQNQQCVVEPFPPLLQSQSTEKDDECPVSETEEYDYPSGSNEAESVVEEEIEIGTSSGERKPKVRKEGESAEEAARKLHFRRGKVVDADEAGESARKLKFRRGRDLGEDKGQDAQVRRSFKKREDVQEDGEEDEDGEKVVLRHQDVQEKDAQGLLNNVIEETASKLVEARKSKVKALVGAFETVISLQESKPPAANSEIGNSSPV
ncbi:hypothetical protein HA466_0303810 [Hirschfeldia incana]|nr:hypothetical protein HA466_0303810 [Hirschfeldia incana]KAJ0230829.1 hypothetical protein HA466_0303810 [Hirschfeldia incana]KAJ0230830.1 hypothetical protein HA466_0303810 [Hirschfeldia incana]